MVRGRVASSSRNEPQFFALVVNVHGEIEAYVHHPVNGSFIVKRDPRVVFVDVVVVDFRALVEAQVIAVSARLGIGESDNLCGAEPRLIRYRSAARNGEDDQEE
jgi:hypothetical protein